jgi:hypothetical protein
MPEGTAELLLHPLRLRIVQRFLGERVLTTAQLRDELADVANATLYRQVAVLAEAGVLEVVSERRSRGATERTYALRRELASVSPEEWAGMSPDEHRAAFAVFVAALLTDFDRYVAQDGADLARDVVGYRQASFYATDEETLAAVAAVRGALAPFLDASPTAQRRRRLLTTVLLPAERED